MIMTQVESRLTEYFELVSRRKECRACTGLTNVTVCKRGKLDSSEIGPWTRWQGDINAKLMVIGQDWGDVKMFTRQNGIDRRSNATNKFLLELLASAGVAISPPDPSGIPERTGVYFTNAILCLKKGGSQADVVASWFENCGKRFLRAQVELVNPRVVVCLGERAFRSVCNLYDLPVVSFRSAVEDTNITVLTSGPAVVPVYHCSRRILNTHRDRQSQFADWRRVAAALRAAT